MSVLVVGAGGHAKVVIAALQAAGRRISGIADDDPAVVGQQRLGVPVVGPISIVGGHSGPTVLAIGSNAVRRRLAETYADVEWATVVHPHALVHESVTLGAGAVVFAAAVVQPGASIGRHAIVNTGATVDHDCRIGAFAHLAPGVHLSGSVMVGEGALMGVGSCASPGTEVGAWGTVGAGGVVVHDLPPNATAVGAPAKPIKERPAGWHL